MDMLLDRKTMAAINTALRNAGKAPLKRKDFRWYHVADQEFADGVAVIEAHSTREEMYLSIDREVLGWAEFNPVALEACRIDGRLYGRIFHMFVPASIELTTAEPAAA